MARNFAKYAVCSSGVGGGGARPKKVSSVSNCLPSGPTVSSRTMISTVLPISGRSSGRYGVSESMCLRMRMRSRWTSRPRLYQPARRGDQNRHRQERRVHLAAFRGERVHYADPPGRGRIVEGSGKDSRERLTVADAADAATAGCRTPPRFRPLLSSASRHRRRSPLPAGPAAGRRPLGRRAAGRHHPRIRIRPAHGLPRPRGQRRSAARPPATSYGSRWRRAAGATTPAARPT